MSVLAPQSRSVCMRYTAIFVNRCLIILCLFIGFDTEGLPSAVWPGGETEALTRIERHLERKVHELI